MIQFNLMKKHVKLAQYTRPRTTERRSVEFFAEQRNSVPLYVNGTAFRGTLKLHIYLLRWFKHFIPQSNLPRHILGNIDKRRFCNWLIANNGGSA